MKPTITLCALLLSITPLCAQDHAPTVEQCRADQRLWLVQSDDKEHVKGLSFAQINDRMIEMANCVAVDRDRAIMYSETGGRFANQETIRLLDFIRRHDLADQFWAEDAAGKR